MSVLWEEYMQNGKINPASGIFLGKNNYGYKDVQDIVVKPSLENEMQTVEEIDNRYKDVIYVDDVE